MNLKHSFSIPLLLNIFLASTLFSQTNSDTIDGQLSDWVGHWEGSIEIHTTKGRKDSLTMHMDILPNETKDSLVWNTRFFMDEKVIEKPYFLTRTKGENTFLLDEKNTIQIPVYGIDNELFSFYRVMGSLMLVRNTLVDQNNMEFAITIIKESEMLTSGGQEFKGKSIPKVESYAVSMVQKARLQRVTIILEK